MSSLDIGPRTFTDHFALPDSNTSEEAKDKARQILEDNADPSDSASSGNTGDQHSNRVLGGYKATLKSREILFLS